MTDSQKSWLRLMHTLSQKCSVCYDNYLYDNGTDCPEYNRINNLEVDGIVDPNVPVNGL